MKARLRELKKQALVVYFIARHPNTPVYVSILALLGAAYAFSPVDLIPDFIPVLGYLDDLLLLPLLIALVVKLTPADVIAQAREQAAQTVELPLSYSAAVFVVLIWVLLACLLFRWLW